MSCEEKEEGGWSFSCAEYRKFKKGFRDEYNSTMIALHLKACEIYAKTTVASKTSKKPKQNIVHELIIKDSFVKPFYSLVFNSLFQNSPNKTKINKPKKQDFPKANNKTNSFEIRAGELTFDDDKRVVSWEVSEGDRACRDAWEHPFCNMLLKKLSKVVWTRATGGYVCREDSYDEIGDIPDPMFAFGPNGEKGKERTKKARRALAGF